MSSPPSLSPRWGFRWRLVGVQLVTLVVLVVALVAASFHAGRTTVERGTAEKVESLGHLIGSQIVLDLALQSRVAAAGPEHLAVDLDDMRELLRGLAGDPSIGQVAVLGADRRPLLAFRREDTAWAELPARAIEAEDLPQSAHVVVVPGSGMRYAAPVQSEGATVGWLVLDATMVSSDRLEEAQRVPVLAASLGGLLATAALGLFLGGRVTRPIAALSEAAARIGAGQRGVRVEEPAGQDELAVLARTFNTTMDRLEGTTEALAATNGSLADANARLGDVNAELAGVNGRLQATVAQLGATNSTLERRNKELEEFAYVASHDLQSPLRAISRFSQLLARKLGDGLDLDGREFLGFIVDGTTRMQALIDDLLDYSRVTRMETPFQATPLATLLEVALQNLSADIADAKGEVVVVATLPTVPVDPPQMKRLLQNLVGNALKYRRDDVPPRIEVSARPEGDGWMVSIADNGIGIAPRHAERVFGIFKRLHGRESKYPGTGIGLAICAKIVERHGGKIWVDQPPPGAPGTIFRFTLPRRAEQGAPHG